MWDNKILSRDQDLRSVTRQIFILDRNYCPLGWISLSNVRNIECFYCFSLSHSQKLNYSETKINLLSNHQPLPETSQNFSRHCQYYQVFQLLLLIPWRRSLLDLWCKLHQCFCQRLRNPSGDIDQPLEFYFNDLNTFTPNIIF